MRETTKMVLVLTIIAMISAGVLSQVYDFTYEIIQDNFAQMLEQGIGEVLPGAESLEALEAGQATLTSEDRASLRETDEEPDLAIYEALDANNKPIGFAYVGESTGYGGVIRVLVGVDKTTKEISGIKILEHVETPGLGSRIEEEDFREQFVGKSENDPIRIAEDIDNLSGATVSATAVADAVRMNLEIAIAAYERRDD